MKKNTACLGFSKAPSIVIELHIVALIDIELKILNSVISIKIVVLISLNKTKKKLKDLKVKGEDLSNQIEII